MSAGLDVQAALSAPPRPRSASRRARTFGSLRAIWLAIAHEESVLPLSTMESDQLYEHREDSCACSARRLASRARSSLSTGRAMSTSMVRTEVGGPLVARVVWRVLPKAGYAPAG